MLLILRYSCVFGASCEHSSPASGSLSFHLHKIFIWILGNNRIFLRKLSIGSLTCAKHWTCLISVSCILLRILLTLLQTWLNQRKAIALYHTLIYKFILRFRCAFLIAFQHSWLFQNILSIFHYNILLILMSMSLIPRV